MGPDQNMSGHPQQSNGAPAPLPTQPTFGPPPQPLQSQPPYTLPNVDGGSSVPPQSLSSPAGGKPKKIALALLALVVAVVLAAGITYALKSVGGDPTVKVGSAYIKAVQSKDISKVEKTIDPEVRKIGDKIEALTGDAKHKQKFYEGYLRSAGANETAGQSSPEKVKTVVSEGGGRKHAVVTYKVGSSYVTALEIYKGDQPYVLKIEKGHQDISDQEFKTSYKDYSTSLRFLNQIIDELAKSPMADDQAALSRAFDDLFTN